MLKTKVQELKVNFEEVYQEVISSRQPVEITQDGKESVSLILTSELNSLLETVYLFQSPANAQRLLDSLARVKNKVNQPQTLEDLCQELGLEKED